MAASLLSSKTSHHVRSNSVPSEPHPLISHVDEHLCRMRASFEITCSSTPPISQKLSDLQDLFDCIDKALLLPLARRALVQESHDELLEGSLRLLDMCDTAKDALLQTREFTHQLQSALRRKKVCEMGFTSELRKFFTSRKSIKKAVHKVLKEMVSKSVEKNRENVVVVGLLKEAEAVTLEAVKSLLSFISGSNMPSKRSLVSKIVRSKRVVFDNEKANRNELHLVDATLHSITANRKTIKSSDFSIQIQKLHNSVGKLELKLQDLEEGLESLYRCLIRTRVSLLNILNN